MWFGFKYTHSQSLLRVTEDNVSHLHISPIFSHEFQSCDKNAISQFQW